MARVAGAKQMGKVVRPAESSVGQLLRSEGANFSFRYFGVVSAVRGIEQASQGLSRGLGTPEGQARAVEGIRRAHTELAVQAATDCINCTSVKRLATHTKFSCAQFGCNSN
jgi:hypothetical protein